MLGAQLTTPPQLTTLKTLPVGLGPPPSFSNPTDAILLQLANGISRQNKEAQAINVLMSRQLDHNIKKDDKKKIVSKNFTHLYRNFCSSPQPKTLTQSLQMSPKLVNVSSTPKPKD
jgi:hypothetical protein